MMRRLVLVCGLLATTLVAAAACDDENDTGALGSAATKPLEQSRFIIEHNATDQDTGFQLFLDGDPWSHLFVVGPHGIVMRIEATGAMEGFGLTEGFFETHEPEAAQTPLDDLLARFPEGQYSFQATSADVPAVTLFGAAQFTHTIPAAPEIVAPPPDATMNAAVPIVISWLPVTTSLSGGAVDIIGYQVIVTKDEEDMRSASFFKNELSIFLPPNQTSVTIPTQFLEAATPYKFEVLAIEVSGNQTISLQSFDTL